MFQQHLSYKVLILESLKALVITYPTFLFQYAHGVAIVFDLSRPETFEGALSWLSDVTQKLFDEKRELAAAEAASRYIFFPTPYGFLFKFAFKRGFSFSEFVQPGLEVPLKTF